MRSTTDVLDVLDRAYAIHATPQEWLRGVTDAIRPGIDRGEGVLAFRVDAHNDTAAPIVDPVPSGIGTYWKGWVEQMCAMPRELFRYARVFPPLLFKSQFTVAAMANVPQFREYLADSASSADQVPARTAEEIIARDEEANVPWAECLALHAADPTGSDVFFVAPSPHRERELPTLRTLEIWGRVMAHVANADRLNRLAQHNTNGPLEGGEAILSPEGRVCWADGPARSKHARDVLRDAARRVDRARQSRMRSRPAEAVELWKALVAGRWSLVDEFDSDGRRFVVARRNDPGAVTPALSEREHQVAAHLAMGQSNKLIAYQLGVSLSTVGTYVRRIANKLGTEDRMALVAACAEHLDALNRSS